MLHLVTSLKQSLAALCFELRNVVLAYETFDAACNALCIDSQKVDDAKIRADFQKSREARKTITNPIIARVFKSRNEKDSSTKLKKFVQPSDLFFYISRTNRLRI